MSENTSIRKEISPPIAMENEGGQPKTRRPNLLADYFYLISLAGLVFTADQWTKALVRTNLDFQQTWVPWSWLSPYARIIHYHNTGAAFGLFKDFSIVFTILALLVAAAILYFYPQVPRSDWTLRLAMGLQLGGAVGNLADRLVRDGQVTDFVSILNFPVFNVADASISIGVVVLALGMWMNERKLKRDSATVQAIDPET